MKKYTPGPWDIEQFDSNGHICYVIADTMGAEYGEEADANADLIAAAPEMLEALELICKLTAPMDEEQKAAYEKAYAALKKARGFQ